MYNQYIDNTHEAVMKSIINSAELDPDSIYMISYITRVLYTYTGRVTESLTGDHSKSHDANVIIQSILDRRYLSGCHDQCNFYRSKVV